MWNDVIKYVNLDGKYLEDQEEEDDQKRED